MISFIGRHGELEILQDAFDSSRGEMAIVYGRRRIGKTALLKYFCSDKETLFFTAKAWRDAQQLSMFSAVVAKHCGVAVSGFPDWISAIEFFCQAQPQKRKILILDEFQYIAQRRPSILSELQAAWDHRLSQKNILLILCGSAVSFMTNEVLGEKNPLYGRARTILKLNALPFRDAIAFFPQFSNQDKFRAYAALGGTPYYCESFEGARDFESAVASTIIRCGGFLNKEPQTVLMQEFRDVASYNGILNAIAHGAVTFSEIAQKSLIDSQVLAPYLTLLQSMNLVRKEFPVFAKPNEKGRASRGIYRLEDNFLKFWFRFIAEKPNDPITREEALFDWEEQMEPFYPEFCGEAFENVCRQYLQQLRYEGKLPIALAHFGRWWFKDVEIDIVGASADRKHCLVAECKYKNEKTTLKVLKALDAKTSSLPIAEDAEIHRWLFSKSGFDQKLLEMQEIDPTLHLVTLDEIIGKKPNQ